MSAGYKQSRSDRSCTDFQTSIQTAEHPSRTMKILLTLCLLIFLCFLCSSSAAPLGPGLVPMGFCCSHNTNMTIPKVKVKNLEMSSGHCKLRSVIVITERKKFCLDPNGSWTQELQREFEKEASTDL
ncbi:C-C motif chemokine 4-like isoform X2 [Girardinichthys multiradiatus]|uniref:C-C motif chemokine 4-like n=1 Tax=Girardinichthys multiradiatus TaxID=208333 RepID=UPI001FAD5640|nr:C-C motif chemokine 4-like [Girardinichthys multiradiatus]XP_047218548.1 C-C motif chemokine 4-like [Girardinichthys multiradiatus]XP_047218549.1 C-C motif chemokine 4-like isoform X1 [Girardinichthys multiradiatus]XP_047218550.1 C-C motif chemokine 4-like isoform X2 [Girardinichthys multiradiatus]